MCRLESISLALYYQRTKAFLEVGKNGLTVDTKRDATKGYIMRLRQENEALKKSLAESILNVQRPKKKSWQMRQQYARMTPEQKLEILRAAESSSRIAI